MHNAHIFILKKSSNFATKLKTVGMANWQIPMKAILSRWKILKSVRSATLHTYRIMVDSYFHTNPHLNQHH